jgi:hypothetical protein
VSLSSSEWGQLRFIEISSTQLSNSVHVWHDFSVYIFYDRPDIEPTVRGDHISFIDGPSVRLWNTVPTQEGSERSINLPVMQGGLRDMLKSIALHMVSVVTTTIVYMVSMVFTIVAYYWSWFFDVTLWPLSTRFSLHFVSFFEFQDDDYHCDGYEQSQAIRSILPIGRVVLAYIRRGSHCFPYSRLLASLLRRAILYFIPATRQGRSSGYASTSTTRLYFRKVRLLTLGILVLAVISRLSAPPLSVSHIGLTGAITHR